MPKTFMMRLDNIQPSQLYISSEKLSEVMKTFNPNDSNSIEPIPIKRLGNDIIFVDGHTRAFAAFYMDSKKFQYIGRMKNLTGKPTKSAWSGAKKRESIQ